jgi:hypothetical protein
MLFVLGQLVTIVLAIGGWLVATRLMSRQLERQHKDSLRLDEERMKRQLTVTAVADLIKRLDRLRQAAIKVSAFLETLSGFLSRREFDTLHKIIFGQNTFPDFNRAWKDLHDEGVGFFCRFDAYVPMVHKLIPERDGLFYQSARVADCRTNNVSGFNEVVARWFASPDNPLDLVAARTALDACRSEFDQIQPALLSAITVLLSRLQNEYMAPLFGYVVEMHRPFKLEGISSLGPPAARD